MGRFKLADCVLEIKELHREQSIRRLLPFSVAEENADYSYEFFYRKRIQPDPTEKILYSDNRTMIVTMNPSKQTSIDDRTAISIYRVDDRGIPYARIREPEPNIFHVELVDAFDREDLHEYVIPDLLQLDIPLARKQAIVLHSSYIAIEGKAILFTAASGGGKSTQADLWAKYMGARIINGDKNIVARRHGIWTACGSPMSGSSPYCLNEQWPIAAIVVLDKGPENVLERVDSFAFRQLMEQTVIQPWDAEESANVMDLVLDLCDKVPIYRYTCTKEESAVHVLADELVIR